MALCGRAVDAHADDDSFPLYVGKNVCLECHSGAAIGAACVLGPMPKHAEAFSALSTPPAAEIAAISGVGGAPQRSLVCLDCHATGAEEGPRWQAKTFEIGDGVQCEACHGAGSFHVDASRTRAGATPPVDDTVIRRGNREICVNCHVEKASHREVLEMGFTLSEADHAYKTPVNLAVSATGARLFVVCAHGDSVVVVDTASGRVLDEIIVGSRPHDAALSPDGNSLYVTNRMSFDVSVIDVATGTVVRRIPVNSEPHGIIVEPQGRTIFVLNTGQDTISLIDSKTAAVTRRLNAGAGPWSACMTGGGLLYLTNVRPGPAKFREPTTSEITVIDTAKGIVSDRLAVPDANMLQGIAALPTGEAVLFTLQRTKNLVPTTRLTQGWTITNGLGVAWPGGRVDQVLLDEPADYFPDPMDVAVSPDGRIAIVTSGGSDKIALVDVPKLLETLTSKSDADRAEVLPNHLGTSNEYVVERISVGANPRGVEFSPDGRFAYVACALDDSIAVIDVASRAVARRIRIGGPDETTELRRGERLFHSATITFGRQFSCHSCHPDGHINGLAMDIEADGIGMNPVDNRTLRGILDTAPFKWEGTNPSLRRQCGARLAVFFTRLAPYTEDELTALVRYMCTIEQPPNPYRSADGLTLQQRRGKAVFERTTLNHGAPLAPEQRCDHCHSGAYKTARISSAVASTMWFDAQVDVDPADMFDANEFGELGTYYFVDVGVGVSEFDVPHLRNIYASPPYLHNGAARTLEEIWTRFNMVNRHGMTFDVTRQQFNDLIAYLKAL